MNFTVALLTAIGEVADKFPNYSQRKANKYFKLLEKYEEETNRPFDKRDDDLVDDLRYELLNIIESFGASLRKENS